MKDVLKIEKILDYYDEPQVFLARDVFETLFLCLLIDDKPSYLAIKITRKRIEELIDGKLDLRAVYTDNDQSGKYYLVKTVDDKLIKQRAPFQTVPENYLPESGYFISSGDSDTYTVEVPKSDNSLFKNLVKRFGWVAM